MSAANVPWWQRPWAPALVILLGVLLHAQVLGFGFLADDWGQQLVLEQAIPGARMQPWSLYDFGTRADVARALGEDVLPWWTDPDWKARFFRPLTSLVLWGESALLGRNAPARHALGLLWHGLYLTLAWRLYRALGLTRGLALLALAVLACEDGAGMSVGWFANRNSLLEGVAVAATGLAVLRARRTGRARDFGLALLLAACAFGAKESGLAAWFGCAAAWWGMEEGRGRRGALAALACASGALAFLVLAGYGTVSAFYPTPWSDPLRYGRHLVGLLTTTPAALLGPYPIDALEMVPGAFPALVGVAVGFLFLVRRPLSRALRELPAAPVLGLFALVSLGTQACALPSDRLLFVPALALAPCAAALLAELRRGGGRVRHAGTALFLCAVPLSAVATLGREAMIAQLSHGLARVFEQAELERAPDGERDVLVLSSPTVLAMLSPRAGWTFATGDTRTRFHPVQFTRRGLRLTRVDALTLELESLDEPFLSTPFEGVFLGASGVPGPAPRGSGAFAFERLAPGRLRVRARVPFEAPELRVLAWDDGRWVAQVLPAIGQTTELRKPAPLSPLVP